MKVLNKSLKYLAVAAYAVVSLVSLNAGNIANAQIPYGENGTSTSTTPVFNQFTGVPFGVGNEADFVRVRPQASTSNAAYVDSLSAACNNGDAYTVRTYVHNGASPDYNDNGNGSAVARAVRLAMRAPLNTSNTNFTFSSTISANNAASVTDTGKLNCTGGKNVKLTLVPSSVKTYSKTLGFQGGPDSAVNGTLQIGSRTQGSGDVYGCWDDRVIVTYDVKVEIIPETPPSSGECKAIENFVVDNKQKKVSLKIVGSVTNADITGYKIDFGDGTVSDKQTDTHIYQADGQYTVTASVRVVYINGTMEWKTAELCKKQISFASVTQPPVNPPVTPPAPAAPAALPKTGAGSVVGIFTLTSVAGAFVHRYFLSRKFIG